MDPAFLTAFGLVLDMLGVMLIFAAVIQRPSSTGEAVAPLALLGVLALMDGFFLQLIATLETARLRDIIQ